jgi:hypothetical protein
MRQTEDRDSFADSFTANPSPMAAWKILQSRRVQLLRNEFKWPFAIGNDDLGFDNIQNQLVYGPAFLRSSGIPTVRLAGASHKDDVTRAYVLDLDAKQTKYFLGISLQGMSASLTRVARTPIPFLNLRYEFVLEFGCDLPPAGRTV